MKHRCDPPAHFSNKIYPKRRKLVTKWPKLRRRAVHDSRIEDARFHALSPRQIEILSIAMENPTSKFIAQRTRYSPATIDKYLSEVAKILDVPDRRRAIQAFEEWQMGRYGNSGNSGIPPKAGVSNIAERENIRSIELVDAEAQPEIIAWIGRIWTLMWRSAGLPPIGGRTNDLTIPDRLFAACKVAFVSTILLIAVALFLKQAFRALS